MDALDIRISSLLNQGLKCREISRLCGISMGTLNGRIRWNIRKIPRIRPKRENNAQPLLPDVWDTKDWFTQHYVDKQLSIGKIAYIIGRSNGVVQKRLRRYGIHIRQQKAGKKAHRPSKQWVVSHYITKLWSVARCAKAAGVSPNIFTDILIGYDIKPRSSSEQLTIFNSTEAGATHRSKLSKIMSAMMANGKLNSKSATYRGIKMRSRPESAVAKELDRLKLKWTYETTAIPYCVDGIVKHIIVDFTVIVGTRIYLVEYKNAYLVKKQPHKLELIREYCAKNDFGCVIITDPKQISLIQAQLV